MEDFNPKRFPKTFWMLNDLLLGALFLKKSVEFCPGFIPGPGGVAGAIPEREVFAEIPFLAIAYPLRHGFPALVLCVLIKKTTIEAAVQVCPAFGAYFLSADLSLDHDFPAAGVAFLHENIIQRNGEKRKPISHRAQRIKRKSGSVCRGAVPAPGRAENKTFATEDTARHTRNQRGKSPLPPFDKGGLGGFMRTAPEFPPFNKI